MEKVFNFDRGSPEIEYLCKKDKRLAKVISKLGPLTYTIHDNDPYAFLIHEIIEQMLSIKAGNLIYSRLVDLCDGNITPERINALSFDQIKGIGTATSKVTYIRSITDEVMAGKLDFDSLITLSNEDVFKRLTLIKGIGKWTANMYLIFVLNRMDVLPTNDAAFLQAYEWLYNTTDRTETSVKKCCKKWQPYSSIAVRYLYKALDSGLTKDTFHLYKE